MHIPNMLIAYILMVMSLKEAYKDLKSDSDEYRRNANFWIRNIFISDGLEVLVVQRGAKETRENW